MLASILVSFYRLWHGKLHLKGAGFLLRSAAPFSLGLHSYPLNLPENQQIKVDFRDVSATYWLNHQLGDLFEEEGLLSAVKQYVTEQSVVWDVGANCGLFCYRLAKEGTYRKIIFFEPNASMFSLSVNVLRPFTCVQGYQYALSNHAGTSSFTIPDGESTIGTLEADRTQRTGKRIDVECRTGDGLVFDSHVEAPNIIKIDTEGHEVAVIQGLGRIIKDHRPMVFFEHISLTDEEVRAIVPDGYNIFSVSDADGSLVPGFDRLKGHNSVLIPIAI